MTKKDYLQDLQILVYRDLKAKGRCEEVALIVSQKVAEQASNHTEEEIKELRDYYLGGATK